MARILVVDDDRTIRFVLRSILEDNGHVVIEASDGIEGLQTYRKNSPDLALVDIYMPNKDGIEMLRDLFVDFPYAIVIAMSSDGNKENSSLFVAKKLGAQAILTKPFFEEDVVKTIVKLL